MRPFVIIVIMLVNDVIIKWSANELSFQTYVEVVNLLKPETAIIAILLPEYKAEAAKDVACEVFLKERWYGIRYAVEGMSVLLKSDMRAVGGMFITFVL